jgi:pimeloyl-ACP methyl ester carboxylesterase
MELNYKKFGESGPVILILHGFLGSLDNWQTVAGTLSEHHIVYTIDQRNHGRSPHADEIDYLLLSADITWFCTQHALQNVIVIGHSMGGKTAMMMALQNPDLVEQLVVVDIAPVKYAGGHEEILKAMETAPLNNAHNRQEIEESMKQYIPSFPVRQFIMKNISRNKDGTFSWKCNLDALVKNYPLLMDFPAVDRQFAKRSAFIKGEHSDYITDENWISCKHFFPAAELYTVKGAGHWVHAENPEGFMQILSALLK